MLKHLFEKSSIPNRVVILGSAGFVGTACHQRLDTLDIPVLPMPRTELDLTTPGAGDLLAQVLRPKDSLLFVSAKAPVKTESMLIDNLQMASAVCEALRKTPVQHLIYISSDAVYKDIKTKINENSKTEPKSLHGIMHLTRELLFGAHFNNLCILRPTLIYGTGDSHNGYGPNRFVNCALRNNSISIFGNGEERRDHIFIEDLVKIIVQCIEKKGLGILNLASGKVFSFKYLAKLVINSSKSKSKLIKIKRKGPMPHNGYRPFDVALLKNSFKNIKISSIKTGIKKYLISLDKQ